MDLHQIIAAAQHSFTSAIGEVPMWNWALQLVGMLTAYVGAELNARMKVSGFYCWLVSNVTLGALHAATGLWLLLLLDVLFFRVSLLGAIRWSKARKYPAAQAHQETRISGNLKQT